MSRYRGRSFVDFGKNLTSRISERPVFLAVDQALPVLVEHWRAQEAKAQAFERVRAYELSALRAAYGFDWPRLVG